jgi:hypothetical protein
MTSISISMSWEIRDEQYFVTTSLIETSIKSFDTRESKFWSSSMIFFEEDVWLRTIDSNINETTLMQKLNEFKISLILTLFIDNSCCAKSSLIRFNVCWVSWKKIDHKKTKIQTSRIQCFELDWKQRNFVHSNRFFEWSSTSR